MQLSRSGVQSVPEFLLGDRRQQRAHLWAMSPREGAAQPGDGASRGPQAEEHPGRKRRLSGGLAV